MTLREKPKATVDAVLKAEQHGWRYEVSDYRFAYLVRRTSAGNWIAIGVDDTGSVQVTGN